MFVDSNNTKYEKSKLEKIAKVGSSHRVFTSEFVEDGIPFYRGTEITMLANGTKPNDCFYISKEQYDKISSDDTKPKINDLLMPSICDKGQIWLVDTEEPFYYKDGRVLSISLVVNNINPKYLHYYMKNKTIEEYPKLGSGSTFAEFKIFLLKDMDIIIPPIELQNKFAKIVEQIDKQKFVNRKICQLLGKN
jgi:type I restriction enzyme S subunit